MWFLYHSSLAANPIREHAVSYPSTPKLSMHGSCLQWAVNTFSAPTPLWGESGSKCRLKSHLCKYLFFTRSIFKGTVFKIVYMYNKITLPLMQEVQTWWELLFFFFVSQASPGFTEAYSKCPSLTLKTIPNAYKWDWSHNRCVTSRGNRGKSQLCYSSYVWTQIIAMVVTVTGRLLKTSLEFRKNNSKVCFVCFMISFS